MNEQASPLDTIQDIKKMMEQSSRFLSLSGLSGIAAGICALVGAWIAHELLNGFYIDYEVRVSREGVSMGTLRDQLMLVGAGVLVAALLSAFYFTWQKARRDGVPIWNRGARRLTVNMAIPLVTGGLVVLSLVHYNEWRFVGPGCLIFYGLALVNASKYTLGEVRYLGLAEIALGLIGMQPAFIRYGLIFWAIGFGILHIIYGVIMWNKYERRSEKVKA